MTFLSHGSDSPTNDSKTGKMSLFLSETTDRKTCMQEEREKNREERGRKKEEEKIEGMERKKKLTEIRMRHEWDPVLA